MPLTMNAVPTPPGWLTVPAVIGVPSPQSMMAVKSAMVAVGLASVNEATGPLKTRRLPNTGTGKIDASVVLTIGWVAEGESAASAMMAEPPKMVTAPPSSVTVTV